MQGGFNAKYNVIKALILKSHEKYELSLTSMERMCKLCMEEFNWYSRWASFNFSISFLKVLKTVSFT